MKTKGYMLPTVLATVALVVSAGIRTTTGFFVNPLVASTALNLADVSLAMAIGQFAYGFFQPLGGFLTSRLKTFAVMCGGAACLAIGFLGLKFANSLLLLVLFIGILSPAGAAASSVPVLMGMISKSVPQERRSFSSGIVNAGGSVGQFIFAPLIQLCLNTYGLYGAGMFLACAAMLSIIPAWFLCKVSATGERTSAAAVSDKDTDLKREVIGAFKNKNYLFLHIGFFACGFHVAFISTHLPGEINFHGFSGTKAALCFSILGLCNIVGCVLGGFLGGRIKLKNILASIYAIRVVLIGVYLVLPKTLPVFIAFAALIGLTYLATVPPTGGITALLVHPKNLSTIFGIIFVTHQIGSFFGAWLAGILMVRTGSFVPMWIIDAALSLTAAAFCFKIVERR